MGASVEDKRFERTLSDSLSSDRELRFGEDEEVTNEFDPESGVGIAETGVRFLRFRGAIVLSFRLYPCAHVLTNLHTRKQVDLVQ